MNQKSKQRIIKETQDNGIFLTFLDYEYEEDFPLFLEFLREEGEMGSGLAFCLEKKEREPIGSDCTMQGVTH